MSNAPRTQGGLSTDPTAPGRTDPRAGDRAHRREHERHVAHLAHDRDERKEFARRHKAIEHAIQVIGSACLLALLFGGWRLFALGTQFLAARNSPGAVPLWQIGLEFVVEAGLVVGTLALRRRLMQAPVRIALGVAVIRSLSAALAITALLESSTVETSLSGWAYATVGAYALLALFHWYAFIALRSHADEIVHLRHARRADEPN